MNDRSPDSGSRGRRGLLIGLAVVAAVGGILAIVVAIAAQRSAPEPTAAEHGTIGAPPTRSGSPTTSSHSTGQPSTGPATTPPTTTRGELLRTGLPPARPVSITISSIGVRSPVFGIGKNPDGTLAVPQPGPREDQVAWYRGSASPGSAGPAVLEGHVDTTDGPSIFYRLGAVRIGDDVTVRRSDGYVATYTVTAVRSYPTHADFPVEQVFAANLSVPSLRLITCSNFDAAIGHYVGNTIAYARLTALHRSP